MSYMINKWKNTRFFLHGAFLLSSKPNHSHLYYTEKYNILIQENNFENKQLSQLD